MATSESPRASRSLAITRHRSTTLVRLPSAKEMWQSMGTFQTYLSSLQTVATVIRQSLFSGTLALGANLLFTQGFVFTGKSPQQQSYVEFQVATMAYVSFFLAIAMITGYASSLVRYRHYSSPETPRPYIFWLWRLFLPSLPNYLTSLTMISAIAYAHKYASPSLQPLQLHFYASGLVVNYYTASLDVISRRIFQTETVEGLALGYVNRSSLWRRLLRAYMSDSGFVVAVFIASGYIHISSRLQITTQRDLVVFSLASMAFRVMIMKITRHFVLRARKIHVRSLYVVAAVPTILIHTQVRMALLRVQATVSMTGVIVLALLEPLMRVIKVWQVRAELKRALCPGQKASTAVQGPTVVPVAANTSQREVPAKSQQWAQRLVQFTAAEIHADMCSEYIAIACSLSTYYCLKGHPKFAWDELPGNAGGRVHLVLVQLVAELAVDFTCCVWETANGIPLGGTNDIHGFIAIVFAGCAITNISLCCSFYLRAPSSGAENRPE